MPTGACGINCDVCQLNLLGTCSSCGSGLSLEAEQKLAVSQQKYLTVKTSLPTGERIYIGINVGRLEDLKWVSADHCDGIGLVRTEFLFDDSREMPVEEKQFAAYKKLAVWAQDKPVIVRTLDAGGAKPIEG